MSTDQQQSYSPDLEPSLIDTTIYIEPEVPNPFLIDEEGDESSDQEKQLHEETDDHEIDNTSITSSIPPPAQEIALLSPSGETVSVSSSSAPPPLPFVSPLNIDKDVPLPPVEDYMTEEEEEVPDLFLPGLINSTMFLPIPNTDPLSTLLTKYIFPPERRPVRDVSGEWKRPVDIHTLVTTNSWRTLAKMSRDRTVASNPADVETILGLWYLRLASLSRLRLSNQTAAECTNLFAVLNAIEPPDHHHHVFEHILPFELEIMHARIKYWSGDHMSYLDALSVLLKKCKRRAREARDMKEGDLARDVRDMWRERGSRVCLILASQLVEMKDFIAATKLLEPLCTQPTNEDTAKPITNPSLRSAVGRIYIQGGNVDLARTHFALVAQDPTADESLKRMNEAILCAIDGQWSMGMALLKKLVENDSENFVAVNNLSVALLSQGKLKEAIDVLEKALKSSPATVVIAEPFLFNLSTLYELRSAAGLEKKTNLLIEVAKWSGDGLKTSCLKMPTN